uniref:Uncharacterized protein n=1 Tax=Sphaerodactylus townsendi TaxID=933632 RepID=A0ACB8FXA5_9SAUR
MPFWKRSVEPRRLLPPGAAALLPLEQLHDVCGWATLALLRQLADLCGHSAALLGALENRLLEVARRAHRLRGRLRRVRRLLRPGAAREEDFFLEDEDFQNWVPSLVRKVFFKVLAYATL